MDDCSNILYDDEEAKCEMGHSESKGAKKREKSNNGNGKLSRGVATSFGFRRRPASSSRADDNARRRTKDDNGNAGGGSTEDLRPEEVLSGRSTPLARPRKDAVGQPLRSNRFGFRQGGITKSAKVGDVSISAEQAFNAPAKEKETTINNNSLATQVSATGITTVVGAAGVPKAVTKQTVILTYQPQQYSVQERPRKIQDANSRNNSANRVHFAEPSTPRGSFERSQSGGKFTLQTTQLPRPQYPALKVIDKSAKQVANDSRKAAVAVDGWRDVAGAVTPEALEASSSPRPRRRPRNLEMVMRGAHSFHLRELQVADLDILDEAVVTEHGMIPLPKLPSSFDSEISPEADLNPPPTPCLVVPSSKHTPPQMEPIQRSPLSTLERYRTRTRPSRIQTDLCDYQNEEKFVLDRAQTETPNKQNSFIKSSSAVPSPVVGSSKESSPSCKSEESHFGHSSADNTWHAHAAGEAMATRSQDDVSLALSVSSCEDEKSKVDAKENQKQCEMEVPKKTIVILDEPPAPHPMLMKSLTLSQHEALRGSMMGSMTSSNYSTTSTCTNLSNDPHNLTLTLEESKFDMSALETSTQSLLDDETSPADSLISSTSTSDSNNDLNAERDAQSVSSSAYQTANTKTRSLEPAIEEQDGIGDEILPFENDLNKTDAGESGNDSKDVSPLTPGTPTHASGSLSLSDGRDFFDDEIADQPGLLFRKNTEGSPSKRTADLEINKHLRKSKERINASPLTLKNRKLAIGGARTPSLDTLSSLASDDLMMDGDLGRSITSLQSVDDYIERLDSSLRSGLNSLDERQLRQELNSKSAARQWSQLLEQSDLLDRQLAAINHGSAPHSLTASTNSLANHGPKARTQAMYSAISECSAMRMERPSVMLEREAPAKGIVAQVVTMLNGRNSQKASLPVRTARLLQRSRTQTPSEAGTSEGAASPAPTPAPASLLQDVVDIKTLLLQLKRVLQEPGEELHTMSNETLDPLVGACAESARGNGRPPPAPAPAALHPDACADLRRQILYLQSQLEERDRLVKVLQQQMARLGAPDPPVLAHRTAPDDTCNVATQTDRLRPPMATTLTASENSGLVSWNEQTNGRKLAVYSEAQKIKRSVTNGTIPLKCQCGARKANGLTNGGDPALQRTGAHVGSKYLQALANNTDTHYSKRETSSPEKSPRKLLYSTRSRSIDNFHNQGLSTLNGSNVNLKATVLEEPHMRHHTSYGDLFNGRVGSRENVDGSRHSPASQNGQSTDTDYSSDGGYKSLPSTISYNGSPPKRVSGIPRRSVETKFLVSKHNFKTSAV